MKYFSYFLIMLFLSFLSCDNTQKEVKSEKDTSVSDIKEGPAKLPAADPENLDIRLEQPQPNQKVRSPMEIKGKARGSWYFEGSFPIKLLDKDGNTVARHYVTAQGEWMTKDFVPFSGTVKFNGVKEGEKGTLVLEKANASGLPQHADSLVVSVEF